MFSGAENRVRLRPTLLMLLPLAGVVIIVILLLPVLSQQRSQKIDPTKYQVVSLVTGQVYFGKLQNSTGEYLTLTSPFTERAAPVEKADSATPSQTILIKVHDQTYGPDDSIAVRADQVIFWQNLRDDSKVTQAIKAKQNQ